METRFFEIYLVCSAQGTSCKAQLRATNNAKAICAPVLTAHNVFTIASRERRAEEFAARFDGESARGTQTAFFL